MTELFLLDTAADEQAIRVPAGLHLTAPARTRLERALRSAGLTVVSLNSVLGEPAPVDEVARRRLRVAVSNIVNDADDAEVARLRAAVTTVPDDGLDPATKPPSCSASQRKASPRAWPQASWSG